MPYTLKSLKDAASFLKKSGIITEKIAIGKLKKDGLEKLLKDYNYKMSELKEVKSKVPKRVTGKVFRAIYPAKPKYNIKALRKEAMAIKKANKLKVSVGKMTQSELVNFISEKGKGLSSAVSRLIPGKKTAYQKKGNMPIGFPSQKKRGRPRKNPLPAQVVSGQRKPRKQRSDKGKKRK